MGGRGHTSVKMSGTAVIIGGGRLPRSQATAFACDECPTSWQVDVVPSSQVPPPRILGGGCALADGTLLMYGGWHPFLGTFEDVWAAHVDGCITPFCGPLCGEPAAVDSPPQSNRPVRGRSGRRSAAPTPWYSCVCLKRCRKAEVRMWSRCFAPSGYQEVADEGGE